MQQQFDSLHALYSATLQQVTRHATYRNAPRGQGERELIGYHCQLMDPRQRFCLNRERAQNIIFNYAEALWYLSGKNDLAFIEYFAPSMRQYSPDGLQLPGTGYGARLRHYGNGDLDQLERAIDVLRNDDQDSKRIVLQIFSAEEDLYRRNSDVSCTLGLQILIRDNQLHMVAFMRANDAYVGLLNDIFSFTFLQEYLASRLGCALGHYTHLVGSIHIYDQTLSRALDVLACTQSPMSRHPVPVMPASVTTPNVIDDVLRYEARIRQNQMLLAELQSLALSNYWRDLLVLFWIYRQIKNGQPLPEAALASIDPYYCPFLMNRWGHVHA